MRYLSWLGAILFSIQLANAQTCKCEDNGKATIVFGDNVYSGTFSRVLTGGGGTQVSFIGSEDTTTIIANPGTGLQTNGITASATNLAGSNPNSYPFRSMLFREGWEQVETSVGVRNFTAVRNKLNDAATDNQVVNYRMYQWDPGSSVDCPDFTYTQAGWRATHADGNCGSSCKICYMGDATNKASLANTMGAYAALCEGIASCGVQDMGWGAYDESNYSSSSCTGTVSGTVPACGVGAEIPDLTNGEIDALYGAVRTAISIVSYPYFKLVTSLDNAHSFDYGFGTAGFGARQDCFGYKKTTNLQCTDSATSGTYGGFQMCVADARTFAGIETIDTNQVASYPNSWQTAPIIQEICGTFAGTWGTTYDSVNSFAWAIANHVSELNVKSGYNPASGTIKTDMETWLKVAGYRLVVQSASFAQAQTAGVAMTVNTTWKNAGNAPDYRNHRIAFKLTNAANSVETYTEITSKVPNWVPSSGNAVTSTINIPTHLDSGTYSVKVGIVHPTWGHPEVQLANSSLSPEATGTYWYSLGNITLTQPSVVANPTRNYASGLTAASLQYMSTPDSTVNSLSTDTDFTGCAWVYLGSAATIRPIYEKAGTSAVTTEYRLRYDVTANRFIYFMSNGTTNGSVNATSLGAPSLSTWYFVCGGHRASADTVFIQGNDGTVNTAAWTGGSQDTTNPLFFGTNGSRSVWMEGRIGPIYMWKGTNPSAGTLTAIYNAGVARYCSDLSAGEKTAMFGCWDMNQATSLRRYDWPGIGTAALVNHWGVAQVAGPH